MAGGSWNITGECMESCNCDDLCPCICTSPQGPATRDQCAALMVYRIDGGQANAVQLECLKFAFVIRSGRVMAGGKWAFGVIVDEAAVSAQRAARAPIARGEAGGPPGFIRQTLVGDFRGIAVQPIRFTIDRMARSAAVEGTLSFAIEGVISCARSGEPLDLDNTSHPANRRLALARAKEAQVHAFGLDLDLVGVGNNGHFAPFAWAA
jgi:hypothetical protein